jgi:hypothetical protein
MRPGFFVAMNFDLGKLAREDPATWIYLCVRAWGKSIRQAAKMSGFSTRAGKRRERAAWWPEALGAMRAALEGLAGPIETLLPLALEVYQQRLKEGDARVAQDVLNRALGKPGQPRPKDEGGPIRLRFEGSEER